MLMNTDITNNLNSLCTVIYQMTRWWCSLLPRPSWWAFKPAEGRVAARSHPPVSRCRRGSSCTAPPPRPAPASGGRRTRGTTRGHKDLPPRWHDSAFSGLSLIFNSLMNWSLILTVSLMNLCWFCKLRHRHTCFVFSFLLSDSYFIYE